MYINDLQGTFPELIIYHFADDTNLSFPAKKLGTIESVINDELKPLSQSLQGKLFLNESKTELIIFRFPQKKFVMRTRHKNKHL